MNGFGKGFLIVVDPRPKCISRIFFEFIFLEGKMVNQIHLHFIITFIINIFESLNRMRKKMARKLMRYSHLEKIEIDEIVDKIISEIL